MDAATRAAPGTWPSGGTLRRDRDWLDQPTDAALCDPIAGSPWHQDVPARVAPR